MGLYNRFCKRFFAAVIVRLTAQADSRALLLSAVRALIFLARRIQPFLSLVNRKVELCVLTI